MRFLHAVYDLQPLFSWTLVSGSQPLKEMFNNNSLRTGSTVQCGWAWTGFSTVQEILDIMISTHTYTSIKGKEIISKWFPLPYLILTLVTSYKLHFSEAWARILALLHAIRNDHLYSGNLCTKNPKKTKPKANIKEEKNKNLSQALFSA